MQENKCKLEYVLSPYTKAVIYTSMVYHYKTAPFNFSTEIKIYHERQKFLSPYMINLTSCMACETGENLVLLVHISIKLLIIEVKAGLKSAEMSVSRAPIFAIGCSMVLPRP